MTNAAANQAIHGQVAPGFERVRDVFAANFSAHGATREVGAAFAATRHGRLVVDLWGGVADPATRRPWTRDTLANVWSTGKGAAAIAVAKLVESGRLAYGMRVADVWPAFAANGKSDVTLAHVLSHQAGLPGFTAPTSIEDQYDWAGCCAKLAAQAPAWIPGAATSYHAITFGYLAGEIVRRVTGRSLGGYLREDITGPLGADVHIGLPATLEDRVARMIPCADAALPGDIDDRAAMALRNPEQDPEAPNLRAWRAAEIPAANTQASATGLALLYASLLGPVTDDTRRTLSDATVAAMTTVATRGGRKDLLMGLEDIWGMGFMLNPLNIYGPGPRSFGHSGWGGSFACADPDLQVAMGYVCNQMGSAMIADERSVALGAVVTACAARAV